MTWVAIGDLKDRLNIPASDGDADDVELARVLAAGVEWVEARVGVVDARTVTETVPGGTSLVLSDRPVRSITSVVGAYGVPTTYDPAVLYIDAEAGIVRGVAGYRFGEPVTVTYVAGTDTPPASYRSAALEIAAAMWRSQRGGSDTPQLLMDEDGAPVAGNMGLAQYRAEQLLQPYLTGPSFA